VNYTHFKTNVATGSEASYSGLAVMAGIGIGF